jgi:hypothetical protein
MLTTGLKIAGKWGSILVLIALAIALLKQLIAFIGFLTFAIKALIVVAFIVVFAVVALLVFQAFTKKNDSKNSS